MRVMASCAAWMLLVSSAPAQPAAAPVASAANLDFEEGVPGEAPAGWLVPPAVREAGWTVKLVEGPSASGARHAVLALEGAPTRQGFGNVMQRLDAQALRGRVLRLAGRGRVEGAARLQLWMRVDREGGSTGFFDNCTDRPIVTADWSDAEIIGVVDADAEAIAFGALVLGGGRAHVDALRLDVLDVARPVAEAPRALSPRGLDAMQAFARLYGVVRFFHASDEAAAADWEDVAIEGVRRVEGAADADALASALEAIFRPLAPTLRVFPTGTTSADLPDLSRPPEATRVLAWLHAGVGLGTSHRMGPYASRRVEPHEALASARLPGVLHLALDATPLRGHALRLGAFVRGVPAEGASLRIGPGWYALAESGQLAGMSPPGDGSVASSEWTPVDLSLTVPRNATSLFLSMHAVGDGRAYVDDVRLEVDGALLAIPALAASDFDAPLQVAGGPIRGWLMEESGQGEGWRSSITTETPRSPPHCALLESRPIEQPRLPDPSAAYVRELPGGVTARLPLAVHADAGRTLPRGILPGPATALDRVGRTADDRATRLAGVVVAWNVMQHFYPYFDVVGADWAAELPRALSAAATDADARAFGGTLARLGAALEDGHVRVGGIPDDRNALLPIAWDVVEDRLVITAVDDPSGALAIRAGDVVVSIDGEPALEALAREEELVSSPTDGWRRWMALRELVRVPHGVARRLDVVGDREVRQLALHGRMLERPVAEPRPAITEEVRAGIVYVDLDRATDAELNAAMPLLERADGIVFDLRGYPAGSTAALAHLTEVPVPCARWNVPVTGLPDRASVAWQRSRWPVLPAAPRWKAKTAFVTDGRAISYAETYLAIVEAHRLAEIVGAPTAGTNGNVNVIPLPGGITMSFTGMKVLKHDGSRHHGVGVLPTVPVSRTIAGVRAGRDELLERAIQVVSPTAPVVP